MGSEWKKGEPTMTGKNPDRFLTGFNRIYHQMRDVVWVRDYLSFYRLIEQAKKKSFFVKKYEDDLRAYAVHGL